MPAIKDAYFLWIVNENHFNFICSPGAGGGEGGLELDSDVISTVI